MVKGPLTTTDMIVFHAGGYGFVPYGLKTGRLGYENRRRIPGFYVKGDYGVPDVAQRVHWDSAWAKAIGNPRAYDYGVLRQCWMYHLLTNWMGDDAWIVRESDQIRKFNYHGDVQHLTGEVTAKRVDEDRCVVDVDVPVHEPAGRGDGDGRGDDRPPEPRARRRRAARRRRPTCSGGPWRSSAATASFSGAHG